MALAFTCNVLTYLNDKEAYEREIATNLKRLENLSDNDMRMNDVNSKIFHSKV